MVVYVILSLYSLDLNRQIDIAFLTNNNTKKFEQENKSIKSADLCSMNKKTNPVN